MNLWTLDCDISPIIQTSNKIFRYIEPFRRESPEWWPTDRRTELRYCGSNSVRLTTCARNTVQNVQHTLCSTLRYDEDNDEWLPQWWFVWSSFSHSTSGLNFRSPRSTTHCRVFWFVVFPACCNRSAKWGTRKRFLAFSVFTVLGYADRCLIATAVLSVRHTPVLCQNEWAYAVFAGC